MSAGEAARQAALIDAWQQRLAAAAGPVRRIETHASVLLIAGGMAYKLKKALDLGFSTSARSSAAATSAARSCG